MIKILIFQHHLPYQKILGVRLAEQKWQVFSFSEFKRVCQLLTSEKIDLVITDVSQGCQPVMDILDVIKTDQPTVLTVIVGPFKSLQDQNMLLERGATELISQPLSWLGFWLRLKNLSQLQKKEVRSAVESVIGTHYFEEGLVVNNGSQIRLRHKENKILECLTKYHHRVLNRLELMKFVWESPADYPSPDTIDVYIRRLRIKLGLNGRSIKTYRGFGYRWEPETLK